MERREPNTKARGRVVAVALAASLVPVMGGGADGLWTPQLHGQGDTHEAMSALVAQADPQQQIGDDLDADATYEGDVTVTSPLSLNGHTLTVTGSLVARADVDLGGGTLAVGGTYAQDSGQLTVGGGTLSVGGDLRFQSVSYDGDGLPSYGSCGSHFVMQDAAGRVEVAGDLWSNSNYMDVEGDRSAGTLSVAGDVRHDDQYRFVTDDGLTVVLAGEGQHEVSLVSNGDDSCIGHLRLSQSMNMYSFNPNPCWNTLDIDLGRAVVAVEQQGITYDGMAKEPEVTVTLTGTKLSADNDYTVAYSNNVNAGTATITVTGVGEYVGTATGTFRIEPKTVSSATVTLSPKSYTYDGTAKKPTVSVTDGTKTLVAGTDYEVSYKNNKNAGKATATVTGKGNYRDTKSAKFTIAAKSLSGATVTLSPTSYTYDGTVKEPSVTVKDGSKTLVAGTDYEVSYEGNVNVGTATATVTGKGNYKDTKSASFSIAAKPLSSCEVTLSPTSYDYDGTAKEPAVTVTDGTKTLVAGTDYEVSYSDNVNVGTATATVTGKGNYKDTKSATFTIAQGQAADGWVDLPGGKKGYRKNGALVKGWLDLGSSKYYFLDDNSMALGWNDVESDGKVMHYYFNPASGNLVRDTWFKIDGKTYYFRPSGNLATGWATISDKGVDKKYFLDENGQLLTGWQDIEVNGKLMHYYFRPSGAMATGWATIDGHNYWFRPSGNMATGFTDVDDGYKRYFDEQGHMVTGWMSLGSNTYYFRSSGAMQTGTATIGGVEYTFSDKGVLIES